MAYPGNDRVSRYLPRAARWLLILPLLLLLVTSTVTAAPPAGYYDSVDDTSAATLRSTIHATIDDHTRFPYTSSATDTWDILEDADEDPGNSSRILDVYYNESWPKYGGGNSDWNREHSWPKSYGFPNDGASNYPYTDAHHLFACYDSYNSSRNNKWFDDISSGTEKVTQYNNGHGGTGESNWTDSDAWEVWAGKRGDIARAMFYMDVRYEGGTHGITSYSEPDLILTDNPSLIQVTSGNASVAYMGLTSTLYTWHLQDPVDADEMLRNDIVYSYQGNRNPFVDNPEWADCIFGGDCSGVGGGTGSGSSVWINEFHYDNASTDVGEFVEVAGEAGTSLSGWKVVAYNGNGGGSYKTINLSGTIDNEGGSGYGALSFAASGLQNGSADGLALIDDNGDVVEFLSYEGTLTATNGDADGESSTDVGVSETTSTPAGYSLQLTDSGWVGPLTDSPGDLNSGQNLSGGGDSTPPSAPTGLAAAGFDSEVELSWSSNSEGDLDGYNVYRSTSPSSGFTKLNGSLLGFEVYNDTSASNGTTYYYRVTAVDTSSNESSNSSTVSATPSAAPSVWINEFHYDDSGSDSNEMVEVAGTAGTNLSGWSLHFYNGNGGGVYMTHSLSGTIDNEDSGYGALSFNKSGIQNGAPDGIALVDDSNNVVDFISYEGGLTATGGPANGMSATDVGVYENGSGSATQSLQLTNSGWVGPSNRSPGSLNSGQSF